MLATIENGKLRTEQTLKVNFGRIESLCGYVMEINYYNGLPFASYSLYNDSHFSGGINQTSSPVDALPEHLRLLANQLIN